jgi:hypothetical protein
MLADGNLCQEDARLSLEDLRLCASVSHCCSWNVVGSSLVGLCSCLLQVAELGIDPGCLQPLLQLPMEGIDLGAFNSASESWLEGE